jgi:hypothetical protein
MGGQRECKRSTGYVVFALPNLMDGWVIHSTHSRLHFCIHRGKLYTLYTLLAHVQVHTRPTQHFPFLAPAS